MTNPLRALAMALLALPLASCLTDDPRGPRPPERPEPPVLGEEWGLAPGRDVYVTSFCGRFFKNGRSYSYGDDRIRSGNSVFVSGDDVYVACEASAFPYALLWKNGVATPLEDSDFISTPNQVVVSDGTVYVAGAVRGRAALWVDGKLQRLQPLIPGSDGFATEARSVFVSGGDVYAGGRVQYLYGGIWKNGVPVEVRGPGSSSSWVWSVFVSGGDVYAAGSDWVGRSRAILYKNGETQVLSGIGAGAQSVTVSDGVVYVAGSEIDENGSKVAVIWRNGEKQRLTDGGTCREASASSVAVSGGDVFVAGHRALDTGPLAKFTPTLWINGEAIDLRPSGLTGIPRSIFVVDRAEEEK